ncbi:MAG: head maturation protease, ClpP-related, partial [Terriglobales bacterium]
MNNLIHANSKCPRKFYAAKSGGVLTLYVYDVITADTFFGGVSAATVAEKMDEAGAFDSIVLRVNSPGGDMFQGFAIKNLIQSKGVPVSTIIDGEAWSAASIVILAGSKIWMNKGSVIGIHNASTICFGTPDILRKQADDLEKMSSQMTALYVDRTGLSTEEVQAMMDKETVLDAAEAVAKKFADGIIEPEVIPAPAAPPASTPATETAAETDVFDLEAEVDSL